MASTLRYHIPPIDLTLTRNEHVRWVSVVKNGWRMRKEITITLAGTGARFEWFILVIGRDHESFPLDLDIVHKGKKTVSRVVVRCVLGDHASVSFTARAIVQKQARSADTHLAFRTLLLSSHARARTIPSLEIATQDVIAGHAASIDRLTEDTLFYCASRGLGTEEAKHLLAQSFLCADLPEIGDPGAIASVQKVFAMV